MRAIELIDFDPSTNRKSASSIDGRIIYSFVLWVEPYLARSSQQEGAGALWNTACALSQRPYDAALRAIKDIKPAASQERHRFHQLARTGTLLSIGGDAESIEAALRLLARLGLAYVVQLAVGAVVSPDAAHLASPGNPAIVSLDSEGGAREVAGRLVALAARSMIDQWLAAETEAGFRGGAPIPQGALEWAGDVFGASFQHELWSRLAVGEGEAAVQARRRVRELEASLLGLRETLPTRVVEEFDLSTVAEILCVRFPLWRQRQFNSGSVFNGIRDLRPLTQQERDRHITRFWTPADGATRGR
ncbi:hypothetical protein [Nonomuraea sp. NPDC050786]|uniref:hypothetical protein n=1 Tax=Nonomuraea sp. NPDC050786 TaxID=3154840 RepID=UPI0033E32B13